MMILSNLAIGNERDDSNFVSDDSSKYVQTGEREWSKRVSQLFFLIVSLLNMDRL